ncbi:MAG: bifunctional ornithine acetyltransferase/N-acetylglutamate synthase, partial [Candidatus Eremiobacteraeota bacterium]|nr:bifunctional ornithine acetyltransferase/N-acetylglutamate synthase [Candidatus Eremiobacteraeota bacterium]
MIDLPRGFRACGVHAGLKKDGQLDVGMLVSESPCRGAAVFTKNLVVAAPVIFDRQLLLDHPESIAGVVLNSKNANAVTGEQGLRDAEAMSAYAQRALATSNRMLVMSTGVIGNPMPMDRIRAGIDLAVPALGPDGTGLSLAMMTTDTRPKTATVSLANGVRLTGFAKGAGMIHPDMATMLSILVTDAELALADLRSLVASVTEQSFNCISVDGDTSTNDTFLVLANGRAGPVDRSEFRLALLALSQDLARQIAFDGEGA